MNAQTPLYARIALFTALSPRQQEIAYLIGQGLPNAAVADQACITTHTVKGHMLAIAKQLQLSRRAELIYLIAYWEGYNAATAKHLVKIVTHKREAVA